MKRIRYGLVGCGRIAANHLKAACACEGIEVAALCDLAPSKGEDLAEKFSLHPVVYRDYEKMLEQEHLDLVAVATDSGSHGTIAAACLWAGCSTLVENRSHSPLRRRKTSFLWPAKRGWCWLSAIRTGSTGRYNG